MFKLNQHKNRKYCYICNNYYNTFICKNCQDRTIKSLKTMSLVSEISQMIVSRDKHIKNILILISMLASVKISIKMNLILSILLMILI